MFLFEHRRNHIAVCSLGFMKSADAKPSVARRVRTIADNHVSLIRQTARSGDGEATATGAIRCADG